jgi:hypothetical protein
MEKSAKKLLGKSEVDAVLQKLTQDEARVTDCHANMKRKPPTHHPTNRPAVTELEGEFLSNRRVMTP